MNFQFYQNKCRSNNY